MQTRRIDLAQTDGWVAITDAATQVLVQLRTNGNVELYVGPSGSTPNGDPLQGVLLTSGSYSVFSAMGILDTDAVFARTVGKATDTDTITVMDNGTPPT